MKMLILASTINRCAVVSMGTGKLGQLGEPIINPVNGQVLGFTMNKESLLAAPRVISTVDIIAIDRSAVIINSPESIVSPDEIVRIKKALDTKIRLLGIRAYSEGGVYLGRVSDILLDTEPISISRYYLRHLLANRIIPADKVVRITRRAIIFGDDVIKINATPEAEGVPA